MAEPAGVFITGFFGNVSAWLAVLGPSVQHSLGKKFLSKNDKKRRLVWVLNGGPFMPAMGATDNPAKTWDHVLRFDVYAFAPDLEDATRLQQALLTAISEVIAVSPFRGCTCTPTEDQHAEKFETDRAYVIVTSFDFKSAKYVAEIDETTGIIGDRKRATARAKYVAFDTTDAIDGDGVFIAPNK